MNTATAIECPGYVALGADEFDKAAFTSTARAERFIESFCLECPVMVECANRYTALSSIARTADGEPMKILGTWGGVFYG